MQYQSHQLERYNVVQESLQNTLDISKAQSLYKGDYSPEASKLSEKTEHNKQYFEDRSSKDSLARMVTQWTFNKMTLTQYI